MSGRTFLDTNIPVYAFDSDEPEKQVKAAEILREAGGSGTHVVSPQVLTEFFAVTTRKLARPLTEATAAAAVARLAELPVVVADAATVLAAIELVREHGLSVWDAMVIQTALEGGCARLLTEDLQHGRRFGALEVVNPFL